MEGSGAVDEVDGDGGSGVDDDAGLFEGVEGADGGEESVLAYGHFAGLGEGVLDGDVEVAPESVGLLACGVADGAFDVVGFGGVDGGEDDGRDLV